MKRTYKKKKNNNVVFNVENYNCEMEYSSKETEFVLNSIRNSSIFSQYMNQEELDYIIKLLRD
jgi:hypothetical protein